MRNFHNATRISSTCNRNINFRQIRSHVNQASASIYLTENKSSIVAFWRVFFFLFSPIWRWSFGILLWEMATYGRSLNIWWSRNVIIKVNADDGKRVGDAYKFTLVPEFQNTLLYSLGEVFEGGKIRQFFEH